MSTKHPRPSTLHRERERRWGAHGNTAPPLDPHHRTRPHTSRPSGCVQLRMGLPNRAYARVGNNYQPRDARPALVRAAERWRCGSRVAGVARADEESRLQGCQGGSRQSGSIPPALAALARLACGDSRAQAAPTNNCVHNSETGRDISYSQWPKSEADAAPKPN